MPGPLCPHCSAPLNAGGPPLLPVRCATCRVVADPVPYDDVMDAIERCALANDTSIRLLRFVDYEAHARRDSSAPTTSELLSTYGGWRTARFATWERHCRDRGAPRPTPPSPLLAVVERSDEIGPEGL